MSRENLVVRGWTRGWVRLRSAAQQSHTWLPAMPQTSSMNTGILHCQWFISLASGWFIIILPSPHPETPSFYFFWAKAVLVNAPRTPANSWIKSTGWQLACFVGDRAALALSASAVMCLPAASVVGRCENITATPTPASPFSRYPVVSELRSFMLSLKNIYCPNVMFLCHCRWELVQLKGEQQMYGLQFSLFP